METMNSKVKKLTDDILMDVAGGLENTRPLSTAVLTDEAIEESKSQNKKKKKSSTTVNSNHTASEKTT